MLIVMNHWLKICKLSYQSNRINQNCKTIILLFKKNNLTIIEVIKKTIESRLKYNLVDKLRKNWSLLSTL